MQRSRPPALQLGSVAVALVQLPPPPPPASPRAPVTPDELVVQSLHVEPGTATPASSVPVITVSVAAMAPPLSLRLPGKNSCRVGASSASSRGANGWPSRRTHGPAATGRPVA